MTTAAIDYFKEYYLTGWGVHYWAGSLMAGSSFGYSGELMITFGREKRCGYTSTGFHGHITTVGTQRTEQIRRPSCLLA